MSRLRLIHCIGSFHFGGIERLVHDLASVQKGQQNIDISIGVNKFKGEFQHEFEGLQVELLDFNLGSGYDVNPFKIVSIYRKLRKFHIIHLHSFNLTLVLQPFLQEKK